MLQVLARYKTRRLLTTMSHYAAMAVSFTTCHTARNRMPMSGVDYLLTMRGALPLATPARY